MIGDNSYTPLENMFQKSVVSTFTIPLTPGQIDALRVAFMAGAAAAYGIARKEPGMVQTMADELAMMADQWETA